MKTDAIIKPKEIKTLKPLPCKPHKENKRTHYFKNLNLNEKTDNKTF